MKFLHYCFVYIILLSFLVPSYLTIYQPDLSGNSNIELRKLQNFPPLPKNFKEISKWPSQFEQFAGDRFPFRTQIVFFISKLLYRCGVSISPEVAIGKEKWLFLRQNANIVNEHRGIDRMSEAQVAQWASTYKQRKQELDQQGIKLFLVIIPNKHTVYPQYLPDHYFQVEETITDQLLSRLRVNNISGVIDLRQNLKKRAGNEKLYDQYNSHWNDRGAYLAYKNLLELIDPEGEIERIADTDLTFIEKIQLGDLSNLIGIPGLKESTPHVKFTQNHLIKSASYKVKWQYGRKEWVAESKRKNNPKALFMCDSFTNGYLYKYLEQTFSESIFKHHRGMRYRKDLIQQYAPDMVFYMVAERLIPDRIYN